MKIKFGALVVDGRNKIGGQVASKNKAGAYLKNKVTPTNPNTSAQVDARANLTTVSRSWSGLDAAQREAWNAYAAQYPYVDIFGDSKYLTGFNYYLKCNLNLLNSGSATNPTPPITQAVSDIVLSFGTIESPDTLPCVADLATLPADHKLVVLGALVNSAGRQVAKSDLRQLKVFSSITAGAVNVSAEFVARFGEFAVGNRLGIASFMINTSTGLVSQLRIISTVAE